MREVNRLGVTGVIDAGAGYQNYPEDYSVIEALQKEGHLTVRLAYKKNAIYDFAINQLRIRAGADPQTFALGMRHNF
ncbi:hypothetical protein CS8_005750 [Cupriavidus sp. 8B]